MTDELERITAPRFARSPADALDCLLDVRRTGEILIGRSEAGDAHPMFDSPERIADYRHIIGDAVPYFWSRETADLVSAASQSYPLTLTDAMDLHTVDETVTTASGRLEHTFHFDGDVPPPSWLPRVSHAFNVFASPVLAYEHHGPKVLSALLWYTSIYFTKWEMGLSLRGYGWTVHALAPPVWWSDGGAPADDPKLPGFTEERLAFTKWVCTAAMFLKQHVLTTERAALPRAVRRRAERAQALTIEPTVHVVKLRKEIADEHAAAGPGGSVDWTHRWLVRGHWRNQYYPAHKRHAPIWIHPHIKGPDDKPFKDPKPTVYAVTR